MARRFHSVIFAALLALCAAAARAETPDTFAAGADALAEGRYEDAIAQLEAYADREPAHPDASFNRGLAYLMRVQNGAERPGDLGRAAAAFEESLAMRDDPEVRQALALVHGEVARRRSRRGEDAVLARPTLDRVIVNLASERSWGIAAVVASCVLALGLVLRRRQGSLRLAGVLMIPASVVALLALVPLYLGARHLRTDTRVGVLVVREAHMTDDKGVALGGAAIPEAAKLELGERRGKLVRARYGAVEGWLPADTIRLLRTR